MGFRRDKRGEREWRSWATAHGTELTAAGVPREVWADRFAWQRFVEHGYHPPASNARDVRFRVADLTEEQQRRLYRFLDSVLSGARDGCPLWALLHSRFGPADGSDRRTP